MQSRKGKILVITLIVCAMAIVSIGSLAWFTATDKVENTIKLASDFDISVIETGATDGKNEYKNVIPGQTISKDPTIKNTGSISEWVRVNVTLSNYSVWAAVFDGKGTVDLSTIFGGFDSNVWTRPGGGVPTPNEDGSITYTFYLNYQLGKGESYKLFDSVTIPSSLTLEQAKSFGESGFTITVEAEAIQVEHLPEGIDSAQKAFAFLEE